jgi:PhnB protein
MTTLNPNLFFAGNAEEVLGHYRAALGGEIEIIRFAGTPAEDFAPPEWKNKVLYGALHSGFGDVAVMDAPPGREGKAGSNFAISINLDDEDRAAVIFAKLASDGEISMPFETTFFAKKFGMTTDKYGVKWMVNVAPTAG